MRLSHKDVSDSVFLGFSMAMRKNPSLAKLYRDLCSLGPVALVGGAPRAWVFETEPRDIDFCVDADPLSLAMYMERHAPERTTMAAVRVVVGGTTVDVWPLRETRDIGDGGFSSLVSTFFFNLDAIAMWAQRRHDSLADRGHNWILAERFFIEGVNGKYLDVNCVDWDRVNQNIARGMVMMQRYSVRAAPAFRGLAEYQSKRGLTYEYVRRWQAKKYGEDAVSSEQQFAEMVREEEEQGSKRSNGHE